MIPTTVSKTFLLLFSGIFSSHESDLNVSNCYSMGQFTKRMVGVTLTRSRIQWKAIKIKRALTAYWLFTGCYFPHEFAHSHTHKDTQRDGHVPKKGWYVQGVTTAGFTYVCVCVRLCLLCACVQCHSLCAKKRYSINTPGWFRFHD